MKTVSVIGLGYVGLPLAVRCVEKGYRVNGIDLDRDKIEKIKKGQPPFKEEFVEERKDLLKKIKAVTNFKPNREADVAIICVPTPVDEKHYPDFSFIESAAESIIKNFKKGQVVVIESTINPGVCEEIVEPLFAKAGLKVGQDYFLAHCPERIDPGNEKWKLVNLPRVVGATTKKGLKKALEFYNSIIDAEIRPMKSIREAEATKTIENAFRDVNIAFVNEIAKSFDQMGIDVFDVIQGASSKFSFMPHWPSCGVGGHCIPVDPYYLIEKAKAVGFDHKFLRTARAINNSMPEYTVELMQDLLNDIKLPMKGTTIGVMGISYKRNIDDTRESPAFEIMELLEKKGVQVIAFDPFVPRFSSAKSLKEFLKKSTAIILTADHDQFIELPTEEFKKAGVKAIVDGKNCLDSEKIKRLGIKYHGIGRS